MVSLNNNQSLPRAGALAVGAGAGVPDGFVRHLDFRGFAVAARKSLSGWRLTMTWSVGLGGRGGGFFRKRAAKYGARFFCGRFRGSGPAATGPRPLPPGLVHQSQWTWHSQLQQLSVAGAVNYKGRKERLSGADGLWLPSTLNSYR